MPRSIDNHANCEICSVIHFLTAKDMKAAEINQMISEVYAENILSEGVVWKLVIAFKNGCSNVRDEEWSGWLSDVTEDFVQKVDGKDWEKRHFTISSLWNNCLKYK